MKLNKDIIIAIDGHASCGKSTLAKQLASTLGYTYIDTGAMYRSVTLYAMQAGLITDHVHTQELINELNKIHIEFRYNAKLQKAETYLNGKNVEEQIRGMEVSDWVSPIAEIAEVRAHLVHLQQQMGKNKRIVMDGRDIGTVVFPQAELKLFLTASAQERARRRFLELKQKGQDVSFEQVLQNVEQRDRIDSTRAVSPLKPASDAIIIDNTNLNIEEQFAVAVSILSVRFGNGIDCLL